MPRAPWSGSISFGLVNVPVRMYSAIEERDVRFHLEPRPEREEPTDLLEALRASVEAHGRRGRAAGGRRNGSPGGPSREELERQARKAGIRGRSKMTKRELAKALERS